MTTRPTDSRGCLSRLERDDRGAAIVMGVVFAVFVLSMLYYVIGIGEAMHYRERMQDAADSAAFSGAIMHARGMNTIVLINLIMAAVLAVLVALRLIETLIGAAIVVLAFASIWGGAAASFIPPLEMIRQRVHDVAEGVKPIIKNVLTALHQVGEVVKVVVPVGANMYIISDAREHFGDVAEFGIAIPPRLTLPVENDDYPVLCGHAGQMAAHVALIPFEAILPGWVTDTLEDGLEALVKAGSGWFCGDEGARPPSFEFNPDDFQQKLPLLESMETCRRNASESPDSPEVQEQCREAEREDQAGRPDPETGRCREDQRVCLPIRQDPEDEDSPIVPFPEESYCAQQGTTERVSPDDCELSDSSAYGKHLLQARRQCTNPPGDGDLTQVIWFQEVVTTHYVWRNGTGWVLGEPEVGSETRGTGSRLPCEGEPEAWDLETMVPANGVCRTETDRVRPRIDGAPEGFVYTRVTQVVDCAQEATPSSIPVDTLDVGEDAPSDPNATYDDAQLGNMKPQQGGGNSTSQDPFRFEEGLLLGTSDMQVRALIKGIGPPARADRRVQAASWNRRGRAMTTFLEQARAWGMLSVAQAEYYYEPARPNDDGSITIPDEDGMPGRGEWMWNMNWTARMRRFRFNQDPNSDDQRANGDSVSGAGSGPNQSILSNVGGDLTSQLNVGELTCPQGEDCDQATSFVDKFGDLFLH